MPIETTPWLTPQTVTNVDRDSGPSWSNMTRVQTEDASSSSAYIYKGVYSDWFRATNFGFGNYISDTATILGVELEVKKQATWTMCNMNDSAIYLRVTAGQVGDNKATATRWPNVLTFTNYGGASDLWGATLVAADVKSADFGVDISVYSQPTSSYAWYANIDYMAIRITYDAAEIVNVDEHTISLIELNQGTMLHSISIIGWEDFIIHRVYPIVKPKTVYQSDENQTLRTHPIVH